MPRIRTLKPEHKQHRKVGPLSHVHYRLWVGMVTEADDDGRLIADPDQLRVLIFGYHPKETAESVQTGLNRLTILGLIRLYEVAGVQYADFPSWRDHQSIDKAKDSKLPPFNDSSTSRDESRTIERDQGSRIKDQGSRKGSGIKDQGTIAFGAFWTAYPKKVGRDEAVHAWTKKGCEAQSVVILEAVEKQREYLTREGGQFIPNPSTWLNQGRWKDDPPPPSILSQKTAGNVETIGRAMGRIYRGGA